MKPVLASLDPRAGASNIVYTFLVLVPVEQPFCKERSTRAPDGRRSACPGSETLRAPKNLGTSLLPFLLAETCRWQYCSGSAANEAVHEVSPSSLCCRPTRTHSSAAPSQIHWQPLPASHHLHHLAAHSHCQRWRSPYCDHPSHPARSSTSHQRAAMPPCLHHRASATCAAASSTAAGAQHAQHGSGA